MTRLSRYNIDTDGQAAEPQYGTKPLKDDYIMTAI